ncbi:hypothetical protein LN736_08540 [Clostridium sp. WLY-B-L2]|uniref:Uncharacterized protein n=1 Tax=Clostridium aromativorans TaxID=2836848 RepID=A0ABS8N5F2_9CLOT|nr:hypothetical protein [Clostridium aromativorans]MCC9294901.1 hypothetical protein [Clostridium aromativorans]
MDPEMHKKYTGVSTEIIKKNLLMLVKDLNIREKIIIRVPFIHNVNDNKQNVKQLCNFMLAQGLRNSIKGY